MLRGWVGHFRSAQQCLIDSPVLRPTVWCFLIQEFWGPQGLCLAVFWEPYGQKDLILGLFVCKACTPFLCALSQAPHKQTFGSQNHLSVNMTSCCLTARSLQRELVPTLEH